MCGCVRQVYRHTSHLVRVSQQNKDIFVMYRTLPHPKEVIALFNLNFKIGTTVITLELTCYKYIYQLVDLINYYLYSKPII